MAYNKQNWKNLPDQSTPLSADRLNNLETQYEEAVSYTDGAVNSTLNQAKSYTDQELLNYTPDVEGEVKDVIAGLNLEDNTGTADSRVLASLTQSKSVWVFTGSSTTSQGDYVRSMLASLEVTFGKGSYSTSVPSSSGTGIFFVNEGQGNTTSADYLPSARVTRIRNMNPDVIVHAVGSNDWYYGTSIADYKDNLQEAIDNLNLSGGKPLHVFLHQHERADLTSSQSQVWDDFGVAMREVADNNENCIFIDTSKNLRKAGVGLGRDNNYDLLKSDKVHLTEKGGEVLGLTALSLLGLPAQRATRWIELPLLKGASGSCHYRTSGSRVDLRYHFQKAISGGGTDEVVNVPSFLLPEVSVPIPIFANGYADFNAVLSIGSGNVLVKNRGTSSSPGHQGYVTYFR